MILMVAYWIIVGKIGLQKLSSAQFSSQEGNVNLFLNSFPLKSLYAPYYVKLQTDEAAGGLLYAKIVFLMSGIYLRNTTLKNFLLKSLLIQINCFRVRRYGLYSLANIGQVRGDGGNLYMNKIYIWF